MPGLINLRPLVAGGRGNLSKSFANAAGETGVEEKIPLPSLLPNRAVRLFPTPASQAVKLQSSAMPRQVTDPLAEMIRARLYGDGFPTDRMIPNYSSSGSEHEPSSVCLAAMVNEFMENEPSFGQCGRARCNCRYENCGGEGCPSSDSDDSKSSFGGEFFEVLQGLDQCLSDIETRLLADVMLLAGSISGETSSVCTDEAANSTHGCLKRIVMKQLRVAGYNAAICKSRWDHSCGIPAGDYEYIDVVIEGANRKYERLIVDIDFHAQFEIARPSSRYTATLQILPPIFVGKPERLQQIINVMSEAAKQSLKLKGLHLPPWRKPAYMKAKWFSPYKRTTNDLTHPCKEGERVAGIEFAGIAVRGSGLDARCTNELEMLYHEAGSRFLIREPTGGSGAMAAGKGHGKRLEKDAPEGAVRNSNRFRSERDEITVVTTDWQPPAVNPRPSQKPGKVTGLASVLMQAGLARPQQTAAKQEERLARAAC